MNKERGAVELDAEGKVRWQYKTDTRVTRAVPHRRPARRGSIIVSSGE